MITYLLAVSDLKTFVTHLPLTNNESIRLYFKKDEVLPVSLVASIKDVNITFVSAETPEELIFDIGLFMGSVRSKSDVTLCCGESVSIPDSLAQTLNIKKIGKTTAKRGPKSGNATQKRGSRKTDKNEAVNLTTDPVKEDTKEEKPKRSYRKSGKKTPETNDIVAEDKIDKIETEATTPASNESNNLESTDIATTFLKQMSVRASDLKVEKISDDVLLHKLIEIFKDEKTTSTGDLLKILHDNFEEADANVIYSWVRPNAKRLHALALEFAK